MKMLNLIFVIFLLCEVLSAPTEPVKTMLSLMEKDSDVCFPPRDVLSNPLGINFLSPCMRVPPNVIDDAASLKQYYLDTDDKFPYLCMGLYDLSYQICNTSNFKPLFKTRLEFVNMFNTSTNGDKFCARMKSHIEEMKFSSHLTVAKNWTLVLDELLSNEQYCSRMCMTQDGKVHKLCVILDWGRNRFIDIQRENNQKLTSDISQQEGMLNINDDGLPAEQQETLSEQDPNDELNEESINTPLEKTSTKSASTSDATFEDENKPGTNNKEINPLDKVPPKKLTDLDSDTHKPQSNNENKASNTQNDNIVNQNEPSNSSTSSAAIPPKIETNINLPKLNNSNDSNEQPINPEKEKESTEKEDKKSSTSFAKSSTSEIKASSNAPPAEESVENDYTDDDDFKTEKPEEVDSELSNQPFKDAEDSHFFAYFITVCMLCIVGYLVLHNKNKILALLVEGRKSRGQRERRPSTSSYRKLDSNLEEAMSSSTPRTNPHVIY